MKYQIAINLFDITDRLSQEERDRLLKGKVDLVKWVNTTFDRNQTADEAAVVFTCPLLEAALICDVIRGGDRKAGDFPTRVYIKREKWSRVYSDRNLTAVVGGKAILNPDYFPPSEMFVHCAPSRKRVD